MNRRTRLRTRRAAFVVCVLAGLGLLVPSAGIGSPVAGACISKRCLYDIEFVAEKRLPDIGVVRLTARFRSVTIGQFQGSRSLSVSLREPNNRMSGTVGALLDIRMPGCIHRRTYSLHARAHFSASIILRGRADLQLDLAPTGVIPPRWAETCPSFRQQNRDLASIMFGLSNQGGPLTGRGSTGHLSVGHDSFVGEASLAAVYSFGTLRRQPSETALDSPWRELWAGRSVVIRQQEIGTTPRGASILDVRLRLTRR